MSHFKFKLKDLSAAQIMERNKEKIEQRKLRQQQASQDNKKAEKERHDKMYAKSKLAPTKSILESKKRVLE